MTAAILASDIVAAALPWIGTQERPAGSNHVPGITDRPGFWDDQWCCMFTCSMIQDAGYPSDERPWTASVYYLRLHAQAGDYGMTWIPTDGDIRPGDAFCLDGDEHIGLVADVWDDGRFVSVEGNWGDQVTQVLRNRSDIEGFARMPDIGGAPDPVPEAPASPSVPEDDNMPTDFIGNDGHAQYHFRRGGDGKKKWIPAPLFEAVKNMNGMVDVGVVSPELMAFFDTDVIDSYITGDPDGGLLGVMAGRSWHIDNPDEADALIKAGFEQRADVDPDSLPPKG